MILLIAHVHLITTPLFGKNAHLAMVNLFEVYGMICLVLVFHEYKEVCNAALGEKLQCGRDTDNK